MKRVASILFSTVILLGGCHPNQMGNTNPGNPAANVPAIDTSRMHAVKQLADTTIKDGTLIKKYPNGVIKEKSTYVAGRRNGECQSFYPSGKLWSDDYFSDGSLDGATTSYYENGQKRYEGSYYKGKPSGTWTFFDETGKKTRTLVYGKKDEKPLM